MKLIPCFFVGIIALSGWYGRHTLPAHTAVGGQSEFLIHEASFKSANITYITNKLKSVNQIITNVEMPLPTPPKLLLNICITCFRYFVYSLKLNSFGHHFS